MSSTAIDDQEEAAAAASTTTTTTTVTDTDPSCTNRQCPSSISTASSSMGRTPIPLVTPLSLWNDSDLLFDRGTELFHRCIKNSIPTGNLYSGGIGAYYLLLEYCYYHKKKYQQQQYQQQEHQFRACVTTSSTASSPATTSSRTKSISTSTTTQYSPYRCKRLLEQALDATRKATSRLQQKQRRPNMMSMTKTTLSSSSSSSNGSCISLLEGDWMGTYALRAVCLYRIQQLQQHQPIVSSKQHHTVVAQFKTPTTANNNNNNYDNNNNKNRTIPSSSPGRTRMMNNRRRRNVQYSTHKPNNNSISNINNNNNNNVGSDGNDDDDDDYRTVVDTILSNIEQQHTNPSTLNCDVIGGRAGALHTIFWLRQELNDPTIGTKIVVRLVTYIIRVGRGTAYSMGLQQQQHQQHHHQQHHHQQQQQVEEQQKVDQNNNKNSCTINVVDDDTGRTVVLDQSSNGHSPQLLFWLCDTQGTHRSYLGAGRGVVGILYTLLGLSSVDWDNVEQQDGFTTARHDVQRTIDECFILTKTTTDDGITTTTTRIVDNDNDNIPEATSSDRTLQPQQPPLLSANQSDTTTITTATGTMKPLPNVSTNDETKEEEKKCTDVTINTADTVSTVGENNTVEQQQQQPNQLHPSAEANQHKRRPLCYRFLYPSTGNLRPHLDAQIDERSSSIDWYQGASGLVMLLLQAAVVYKSKIYLQEAHRICDGIIFPRGLYDSYVRCRGSGIISSGSKLVAGGSSPIRPDVLFGSNDVTTKNNGCNSRVNEPIQTHIGHPRNVRRTGPVGMTGMTICFFQLSQLCKDYRIEGAKEEAVTPTTSFPSHESIGSTTFTRTRKTSAASSLPYPSASSLSSFWRDRAILFAQRAHNEWVEYLETDPIGNTPGWNPFSLYEGMGGLVSVMWQLASSSSVSSGVYASDATTTTSSSRQSSFAQPAQIPLYSGGAVSTVSRSSFHSIFLTEEGVTLLAPPEVIPTPGSPPQIRRTNNINKQNSSSTPNWPLSTIDRQPRRRPKTVQNLQRDRQVEEERKRIIQCQLEESRRRRAALDEDAARRKAHVEDVQRRRLLDVKERKAQADEKRRADLDARKHSILMARKRADAKEEEDAKRRVEEVARKNAEDEAKRVALLSARKQAKERVEIRRKAREEEERRKEEAEAERRAAELKAKQIAAEEEATKRRTMMETILKRKARELEIAKQREYENQRKEEEDRKRRMEELKRKEEERKRKEEERNRKLQAIEHRRKEEEAKRRTEEEVLQRRKEEEILKRRKQLEVKLERQKQVRRKQHMEAEDLRLRQEHQAALEAEAERRRLREKMEKQEDKLRRQKELTRKLLEANAKHRHDEEVWKKKEAMEIDLVIKIRKSLDVEEEELRKALLDSDKDTEGNPESNVIAGHGHQPTFLAEDSFLAERPVPVALPHPSDVYSPSDLQKKETNPLHFSVPTKESLFWSLQTETNIGDSENYKPAMVPTTAVTALEIESATDGETEMGCVQSEDNIVPDSHKDGGESDNYESAIVPETVTNGPEVKPSPCIEKSEETEMRSPLEGNIVVTFARPDTLEDIDDNETPLTATDTVLADPEFEPGLESVSSAVNIHILTGTDSHINVDDVEDTSGSIILEKVVLGNDVADRTDQGRSIVTPLVDEPNIDSRSYVTDSETKTPHLV